MIEKISFKDCLGNHNFAYHNTSMSFNKRGKMLHTFSGVVCNNMEEVFYKRHKWLLSRWNEDENSVLKTHYKSFNEAWFDMFQNAENMYSNVGEKLQ